MTQAVVGVNSLKIKVACLTIDNHVINCSDTIVAGREVRLRHSMQHSIASSKQQGYARIVVTCSVQRCIVQRLDPLRKGLRSVRIKYRFVHCVIALEMSPHCVLSVGQVSQTRRTNISTSRFFI